MLVCCFVGNSYITCITESVRTVLDVTFFCVDQVAALYVIKIKFFFNSSI